MEWDEWECGCVGTPPLFELPPPPPPPHLMDEMFAKVISTSATPTRRSVVTTSSLAMATSAAYTRGVPLGLSAPDCPTLWSCPALLGARGLPLPPESRLPVTLVVTTALSLVIIVIVIAALVYRLRITRNNRSPKNCTELNGGIVYEDLPSSAPTLHIPLPSNRAPPPRYKPPLPHIIHQAPVPMRLYTPEPNHGGYHRYHSISSGCTETCSCSISETPSCALLPNSSPHTISPAQRPLLSSDDDTTPTPSPYHHTHHHHQPYGGRRPSNSTLYESLYYTGGSTSSNNSQPRGLPPLPSRSDRFRIYFSGDGRRSTGGSDWGSGSRGGAGGGSRKVGGGDLEEKEAEIEPLYENT